MNKITKLLSVFVIAGAIGTGVAGAVGCGGGNGGNGGGGHTSHTYTYTDQGNGKHTGACTGCDSTVGPEDHTWGSDNKCTASGCDATKPDLGVTGVTITTQPQTIYVGGTVELEATVATSKDGVDTSVTWNIVTGQNYATIEGNVLTATKRGTVNVQAVSVADPSKKSSTVAITIEEANLFAGLIADTANNIIGENFEDASKYTDGKLPTYAGYTDNTTPGVYAWGDGDAPVDGCGVVVSNGKATHVTASDKNASIVADLTGKVKDIVEGYVELSVNDLGNDWAVMALTGKSDAVVSTSEVFALVSAAKSGNESPISYRIGGKQTAATQLVSTDVKFVIGTTYEIHYTLDMVSGLITVDVKTQGGDSVNLCTDVQTGITELKAVTFVSSNKGARLTTIDNLAVNSKAMTLAEVQTSLGKKLDSYVAAATVAPDDGADTLTLTGDGVTSAVEAVKTAIGAAADIDAAKAAYTVTTVDAAILAQAQTSAKAILTAYRSDESFTHEDSNKAAMDNAKAQGASDIQDATDIAGVRTALAAAKVECGKVLNDEADNAIKVDITLKLNNDAGASVGEILQAPSGTAISLETLISNVQGDKYLKDIKIYTDAEHTSEITTAYTPADTAASATLYVVITDTDNTGTKTITVADSAPVEEGSQYVTLTAGTSYNKGDFKFAGSSESITLKIKAKAGQKITLTTSGFTGSTNNAAGISIAATNATTTDATTIEYGASSTVNDQVTASIVYTVTEDGEVTLTITRSVAKTARVTNITVAIANAE